MNNHFEIADNYDSADVGQDQQYQQQPKYQKIYQMLLASRQLLSLDHFRQRFPKEVFQSALIYPDFFQHNLISDGRVIKVLKGKNAILKAFYYQLFKLTFQLQVPQKDYVQIVKSVIFDPELVQTDDKYSQTSPISGKKHPQIQYKKLLAQFIQMLINQSPPNFQMTLNQYPIIDQALQLTFEFLIGYSQRQAKYTNEEILGKLSQIFDISVTTINKCYKFEQSDVFLYEHNQNDLYMAFLNQMQEVDDSQNQGKSSQKSGGLNQEQNNNLYADQHDQFINRPIVTQTGQFQPKKLQEYQGKHNYSVSQPQNFSPIQQYRESSDKKYDEVSRSRQISNNNEGSLNRKQQTIMNMLGDISKSGEGSFAPFNRNILNTKTSDFRQTNMNELGLSKMESDVEKYDALTTNRSNNSQQNLRKVQPNKIQKQVIEIAMPFYKKRRPSEDVNTIGEQKNEQIQQFKIFQTNGNSHRDELHRNEGVEDGYKNMHTNRNSELSHGGKKDSGLKDAQFNYSSPLSQFKPFEHGYTHNYNQNSNGSQNQYHHKVYSQPQYSPNFQTYSFNPNSMQNYSRQHYSNTFVSNQNLSQQPLIYKPQKMQPNLQTISQMTQSKQAANTVSGQVNGKSPFGLQINFNKNMTANQKKPKELGNDDSKGTFYRQFTNTKILQLVKQPYRTKVQLMKNRFVGVRSRNYMGPGPYVYDKRN